MTPATAARWSAWENDRHQLRPLPSRDYIAAMLRRSHIVGLSVLAVASAILVAYFAFPAVFERPRRVLEVGCGHGANLRWLLGLG